MLKFYLFFAFCTFHFPSLAGSVVIEIRPNTTTVTVQAFLPISGYSNPFFPTEFVIDQGVLTLPIHESKTVGIYLYFKNYELEVPVYVMPDEEVRILLNTESKDNKVVFDGVNARCHSNFFRSANALMKEYIDLFITYSDEVDTSLVLSVFRKELQRMRDVFDCSNDSLLVYYQQQMCLDLMGSLHRKYRGSKGILALYDQIIDEFRLDQGVRGSISCYGYFYYLSYELPRDNVIQPKSSLIKNHQFLFSIPAINDLSYMLQVQFLALSKMNVFTSSDAKCEAFNDIKDFVKKSEIHMAQYFMDYFPERYNCEH